MLDRVLVNRELIKDISTAASVQSYVSELVKRAISPIVCIQ